VYTLTQAPIEQRIIRQCFRERSPLPDKIANAPKMRLGLELYYGSFWDLSSCRVTGWSLGPIPWTAIHDYARAYGFDEEQTDDLIYYVRELDIAYLQYEHKKAKQKWPTSSASSESGWGSGRSK
jgi:hypothetical protein